MKQIDVSGMEYRTVNAALRETDGETELTGCLGQRFIAAGFTERKIVIRGVPGNALGAYLNGAEIEVFGNAQDAVGDTMNNGRIVVHGSIGDAAGYAMRGGEIFVRDDAGYRAGIHMKEYKEKCPVLVVGGKCGSFLGEYQAGGIIIVLGLNGDGGIVGDFPFTGMHGGKVYLRGAGEDLLLPENVRAGRADGEDMERIRGYLRDFCGYFGYELNTILNSPFVRIEPDSSNPYKQMYAAN